MPYFGKTPFVPKDDTVVTSSLQDDAVTLAKLDAGTAGNLITYNASGNPAAVSTGSSTQVLTSNGAGAAPTFQAAAAGGNLVQLSNITTGSGTTSVTGTGTSATQFVSISFTPISTDNRLLIVVTGFIKDPISGGSRKESRFSITTDWGTETSQYTQAGGAGTNRYNEDSTLYRAQSATCGMCNIAAPAPSAGPVRVRANGVDLLGVASSTEWAFSCYVMEYTPPS